MYDIARRHLSGDRGLSLLEVLISMLVLSIGILGLAPMIVLSIEGNTISRDYSIASELAKEQLEYYEGVDWLMPEDASEEERKHIPKDGISQHDIELDCGAGRDRRRRRRLSGRHTSER